MKKLSDILQGLEYRCKADISDILVSDIAYNSKKAKKDSVFVCLRGARSDGHNFARNAYENGARIFVCEYEICLPPDAVIIETENTRIALAHISANFFSHPEKKLFLIGITGTKGKSSTCAMIYHALNAGGIKTGSIGTYGVCIGNDTEPTENSTPESYELYRIFDKMVKAGIGTAVMEVSSQSVFQERIHGLVFDIAIMTNLSPDHIGKNEHPDFEHYKNCKKALFGRTKCAVLNLDDKYCGEFADGASGKKIFYSAFEKADFYAEKIEKYTCDGKFGISFIAHSERTAADISLPFPGIYSVYNALAAAAACNIRGLSIADFAKSAQGVSVPGRFEYVDTKDTGVSYIIDYAHTGASLRSVTSAVYEYHPKRIICVFGSVGGRTELRRRELGEAANKYADYSVITADNPDFEDPRRICFEIAESMDNGKYEIITDRESAVRRAVDMAEDGDIVIFAGKGHERYQLINGKKLPFSERDIIKEAANAKAEAKKLRI